MANNQDIETTDFKNGKVYNEVNFADAMANGICDFITYGLEFDEDGMFYDGAGVNHGLFFQLGTGGTHHNYVEGWSTGSGLQTVLVETTLDGLNTITRLVTEDVANFTDNKKYYFKIYDVDNTNYPGFVVKDYRFSSIIKTVEIGQPDDEHFTIIINGMESLPFSTSVTSDSYTKSASDERFQHPQLTMDTGNALGIPTNDLNYCVTGGFYRYSSTNPNAPEPVAGVCIVTTNNASVYQQVQDANNKNFTRLYDPGTDTWSEWKRLVTVEPETLLWQNPEGHKLSGTIELAEQPSNFEYLRFELGNVNTSPIVRTSALLYVGFSTNAYNTFGYPSANPFNGEGSKYKSFKQSTEASNKIIGYADNANPGQLHCFKIYGVNRLN